MNLYAPHLTDAQFAALPLKERFVLVAAYYADVVKVHEQPKGSNRGPEIDAWAKELGVGFGLPWCGIFVTHCLREAGYKGPLPENPASTHSWAEWARANGHVVSAPERGDIFVLLFNATEGHMGVCLQAATPTPTIEGNTNADGSREGYEVARKERFFGPSVPHVFVRLPL